MSKVFPFLFCFFVLTALPGQAVLAQTQPKDTAFVQAAISQAVGAYRNAIGNSAHLYTGIEYFDYRKYLREGHQFLVTDELVKGDVVYEGILYEQVPLLYDIVKDELIVKLESRAFNQKLISQKVAQFNWKGQVFQRFPADSLTSFQSGFYELLLQNEVLVLAKRAKIIEEVPENRLIKTVFRRADGYYIQKDLRYYPITSKRSLYTVFKDQKKELKRFYRVQDLKFRANKEKTIVAVATEYVSLTK
ncbi:hypothetical protein ACMA1I_12465 [Pontibacter sp. 13R65]|uniref:hypothetical protein n=1 Tax=Pontibacter sp. 13R65 TaxID=3127458 RepID=UPI00301E1063